MSDLPAPGGAAADLDMRLVAAEWGRRTEAEYRSAAIAQHVTLWLIQVGAPPDLIRAGLQVVEDELAHSELSAGLVEAAGGGGDPPFIDGSALTFPSPDGPVLALGLALMRFFCIGETVAVPMFRMLRARATEPRCRQVLDIVLRDEARHRQFGWDGLDWLLAAHEAQISAVVGAALPAMLDEVQDAYGGACEQPLRPLSPAVEAWGLAPPAAYAETARRSLADDVAPRLRARGLAVA